jgi:hypothetical protein
MQRVRFTARESSSIAYFFKFATLGLLVIVLASGHYPPAHAQDQGDYGNDHPNSIDLVQNEKLREMNRHLESNDTRLDEQNKVLNELRTGMTHTEGVTEGFGMLLTLMVGGSITFQVRSKKGGS